MFVVLNVCLLGRLLYKCYEVIFVKYLIFEEKNMIWNLISKMYYIL